MQVRISRPKDLETLVQIESLSFPDPWTKQSFDDMFAMPTTVCLVAEEDDTILGYAFLMVAYDQLELLKIAVRPELRKRGVGACLMESMFSYAKENEMTAILLEVRSKNEAAISLYERFGFTRCGIRKDYYKNPSDNAVMMWFEFPLS